MACLSTIETAVQTYDRNEKSQLVFQQRLSEIFVWPKENYHSHVCIYHILSLM